MGEFPTLEWGVIRIEKAGISPGKWMEIVGLMWDFTADGKGREVK
jgi:hypothetical protein